MVLLIKLNLRINQYYEIQSPGIINEHVMIHLCVLPKPKLWGASAPLALSLPSPQYKLQCCIFSQLHTHAHTQGQS